MPRISRGLADNAVYHVLNRGNARQTVFHGTRDYSEFTVLLHRAVQRHPLAIFAFCLMPNHFHLTVRPNRGADLSCFMQWLLTSHVRRHHQRNGTSGHVWQGRYKSFLIQEDEHLMTVMRYVERNPVRAGLVEQPGDWPWSSHRETSGASHRSLTTPCPLSLPAGWAEYVSEPLTDAELGALRRSVGRQAPYGESDWRIRMCEKHGLQSTLHRGRPKAE